MRLLAIGDVCGSIGCEKVRQLLPNLKKENKIDMVIINGENSADGNGITPSSADYLFACGADVITGGNHSLRRKEVYNYLNEKESILRPYNVQSYEYGKGFCIIDFGYTSVAVINLIGKIYLDKVNADCPFKASDKLVDNLKINGIKNIVVDFHAEATSEKKALGFYLDGRVSAVFGTHTHVQTSDDQILQNGTGYITDLGMTGPKYSVLGVKKEIIINRLKDNILSKFELETGECMLNACIFDIENSTGKTKHIERINI